MSNTMKPHKHNSSSDMVPKRNNEALTDTVNVMKQLKVRRKLYVAEEENESMQEEATVLDKEIADLLEDSETEESVDVYFKICEDIETHEAIVDKLAQELKRFRAVVEGSDKNIVKNPEFIKIDKQVAALYDEFKHTKYWDEYVGRVVPFSAKGHVEE